ncbi:MAG TPA: hypothetical protein VMK12_15405 [Anaeromyxobacteraceae bacterium]|nr:hypothetical protein [Anaeromyxobacteraceae bacterium]
MLKKVLVAVALALVEVGMPCADDAKAAQGTPSAQDGATTAQPPVAKKKGSRIRRGKAANEPAKRETKQRPKPCEETRPCPID